MKTYTVQKNQSIVDLAIQLYGNVDAVPELLALNPVAFGGMGNDFDLGTAVRTDTVLSYDETSVLYNKQMVDVRAGEILATATENTVLVELPEPPGPDPYVFHVDTQAYLDALSAIVSLPDTWESFFTMAEAIVLDRFVRDLHGEANTDYTTVDVWGKFLGMYPMMGSGRPSQVFNLVDLATPLSPNSAGVTHAANTMLMDGVQGNANTHLVDGVGFGNDKVSLGVVFSNFVNSPIPMFPDTLIGTSYLGIKTINGKYNGYITQTSGGFGNTTPLQLNDYLHLDGDATQQRLFLGGNGVMVNSKAYVNGACTNNDIYLSTTSSGKPKIDFHLAYVGVELSTDQRKSLMNSVNYFMYQKGVRGTFTAIN